MIIILILEYSPEKEKIDLEKLLNNKGFASNNLKLILLINFFISITNMKFCITSFEFKKKLLNNN